MIIVGLNILGGNFGRQKINTTGPCSDQFELSSVHHLMHVYDCT